MLRVTFLRKEKIADDTWQFFFTKPHGFDFKAGQYTTVFVGEDNRDFTICANPTNKETFSIVTKPGISTFKKTLFSLPITSEISMKEPSGGFVLYNEDTPKVFLAGGIGLTPFYSMITYVSAKKINTPITLLVSFSKKSNFIFYDELVSIARENSNIKIIYTVSKDTWENEMGRISEELIKKYVLDLHTPEFFVAGGVEMVEDTEELLLHMGVAEKKIRIDIFTGY